MKYIDIHILLLIEDALFHNQKNPKKLVDKFERFFSVLQYFHYYLIPKTPNAKNFEKVSLKY